VSIDQRKLVKLISEAGRLVGLQELLRTGGFHAGQQSELKHLLRELVRSGQLERDGKRYAVTGQSHAQRSGPAWRGKRPASPAVAAVAEVAEVAALPGDDRRAPEARKGPPKTRPTRGVTVEGIIHHHPDGFAFVKPLVGQVSEDLFIPPDEARKALDHDQVKVEVVPGRGGRTMGRVVEVQSRTRQFVVGTYQESARGAWVKPREVELGTIRVPPSQLARPGDLVKVRLGAGASLFADRGQLTGEVAGSLGSEADHSVEVLSVAYAKGFHDEFPPEVIDEADAVSLEVAPDELERGKRRDLRALPLVTIDGEDARDFDDAICVEAHPRGWRLVVAIADVAHYVTEHSALDTEALRRATSVYLPGRVLPMLPERLSNGICSLKPEEDRLCMVADLTIDRHGVTVATELYPAVMNSHARCTYEEVHRVLAGEAVPGRTALRGHFERAHALATRLTAMRLERGAIDFDLPETRVELDEQGLPRRMVQRARLESHRLVEECMLAANEAVARFFREQGLPTVNRFHGEPDEEKLGTFLNLLKAYGIPASAELDSRELNRVLKSLEGHAEQRALNQLALRAMMQAVYSSHQSGHYGLGASDYLHFTSPIRRYPDLLVHRLLKAFWSRRRKLSGHGLELEADRLEMLAVQCSERERAAMQVEREVSALYACLLMKDRVGESFAATVGGLSEHGFFVSLDEHHVEGFVRGETVFPGFELDPATYRLQFGDGRVVRVGQKATVRLISVNLTKKQMEFVAEALAGATVEALEAPRRPERGGTRGAAHGGGKRQDAKGKGKDKGRGRGDERRPQGPARAKEPTRRPQPEPARRPPPEPVRRGEPKREDRAPAPEVGPSGQGFDARAVLDRLWRERGGGQKKPRSSAKPRS
jgi:ribonuclease R